MQSVLLTFIVSAVHAFQERLDWVEAYSASQFKSSATWAAQLRLALDKCEAAGDAEGGGCGGGKAPSLQLVAAGIHPTTPTTST